MHRTDPPRHADWAEEAHAAERAGAWPQAEALWRRALATCGDTDRRASSEAGIVRCQCEVAIDQCLDAIARRILAIPTLDRRGGDRLDFHEVAVWSLREALRLAYRAGREAPR